MSNNLVIITGVFVWGLSQGEAGGGTGFVAFYE